MGKDMTEVIANRHGSWNILIMDEDNFTHIVAKEIVKDIQYLEKPFNILSAYSSEEAMDILSSRRDIALVILDPFTRRIDCGFKLIEYIRDTIGNLATRIVIMTNRRSNKFKRKAMFDYGISGYEQKSAMLPEKFLSIIIPAIRSYKDMLYIDNNKKAMRQIASSSSNLIEVQSIDNFMKKAFHHFNKLLNICLQNGNCSVNGIGAIKGLGDKDFTIVKGLGSYEACINKPIGQVLPNQDLLLLRKAQDKREQFMSDNRYISCYDSSGGVEGLIFMEIKDPMETIDRELLNVFDKNVSTAFESLCLNQEIEATQKEVLYILGEVTEARSEETGNHVKRVSLYSKLLAQHYGLDEEDVRLIATAAPIHDVGKVAIPDDILLKPGRLTPEEFQIIKTHTTIGYNLLRNSNREVLKSAAIIAHEHHERYDGKGYPRALKGEDIHIYGRIVCVADVFDALGSPRVYKKGWVIEDILNYFKRERGGHFDPRLVDILFDNLDEFMDIRERYSDEVQSQVIGDKH